MTETLSVSALHVSAKDLMVMRSLLNLVNGRGDGYSWQLLEQLGGDLTIVDVDSSDGRQAWDGLVQHTGALIAMSADKQFAAPALLLKPLRARDFLALLRRLAGDQAVPGGPTEVMPPRGTPTAPSEPSTKTSAVGLDETDPSEPVTEPGLTLADHLRLQTWTGPVALTWTGWPLILIDPGSGAWFYDGSIGDLEPTEFARPLPERAGVALSSNELVDRIHGHRQRALSELKWYAGLAQMPGRLHPDLRGECQFMLAQVPVEAMKNDLLRELAQIVLRGPIELSELVAESGQPDANVVAFLNACYASGKLLINRDWQIRGL